MFENQTEEVIKQRMINRISNDIDKSERSFTNDSIAPTSSEFAKAYINLDVVAGKIDPENLEGEELERFVNRRTGITRKLATKATTPVTINGQEGAIIKIGDLVGADTVHFLSQENKTIDATGEMTVFAECEKEGAIGNVPAGAIKYFPIGIAGLTSVTNLEPVTNGYDAESDESLLERYYEYIRTPATSGNKYHYRNWAKEVVGVGDVKVFPLWNGDNTVKVVIIDSNKQPASTEVVAQVQEYIDPGITGLGDGEAPLGAFCTVASATPKTLNISFTAVKDTSVLDAERQQSVENNLNAYIKELSFETDENNNPIPISYNRIGSIILDSKGILDYSNLTINGVTSNITIGDEEVPVLGQVVINE